MKIWIQKDSIDEQSIPFTPSEINKFTSVCDSLGIAWTAAATDDLFPSANDYLWGSCELNKITTCFGSSVRWGLYTPLVLRTIIKNQKLYNEIVFSPITDTVSFRQMSKADDFCPTCHHLRMDKYFIKPLLSDKTYPAHVATQQDYFDNYLYDYHRDDVEQNDEFPAHYFALCADGTSRLGEECRSIVLNGKVVSCCTYATGDGKMVHSFQYGDYSHDVKSHQWTETQRLLDISGLNNYYSAAKQQYYVLDTIYDTLTKSWKINETNAFWTSGLYGGDPSAVLEHLLREE